MAQNRSTGDGSIYWVESMQRYRGALVIGWRDGKPLRRTVTGTTRAKVASRLRQLRAELDSGEVLATGRVWTVEQWVTYWLDNICPKRVNENTLNGYRSKMMQYVIPLLGDHRLDRLRPEHVEQAWDELVEVGNPIKSERGTARPLSTTTAHQTHVIFSRCLKVAMQRERVGRNVCTLMDAPPVAETDVQAMTPDEARAVLAFSHGVRNAARWSVALSLGLRQGEALGLQWCDVDFDAGTISVRRALARVPGRGLVFAGLKSKRSKRTLSLDGTPLLGQLRAQRAEQNAERLAAGDVWQDHDLIFAQPNGKPVDPRADWREWRRICAGAGVAAYRLHDARHTAATLLLLQGVSTRVVMDVLGHSQISVTTKYQHVVDELMHEASRRMGAALWPDAAAE